MSCPIYSHFLSNREFLFVEVPKKNVEFNLRGLLLPDSDFNSRNRAIFLDVRDDEHLHFGTCENFYLLYLVVIWRRIFISGLEHIEAACYQSTIRVGYIISEIEIKVYFVTAKDLVSFESKSDPIR